MNFNIKCSDTTPIAMPNRRVLPYQNEKIQNLISWTFHKHLCWLTYNDTSKHTNKPKHIQTHKKHTFTHTHLLTRRHTYINVFIHIYIYICIYIYTYTYTCMYIYIYIHLYIYMYVYIYIFFSKCFNTCFFFQNVLSLSSLYYTFIF